MLEDLPAFEIGVLRIQPGDMLVVRVANYLTLEQAERLHTVVKAAFARAGHPWCPAIVLEGGTSMEIIRPEQQADEDEDAEWCTAASWAYGTAALDI